MAMKVKMRKCLNYRSCGRQAKGPYAKFCTRCFVANAKLKGSESSGNSSPRVNPGNVGNASASGTPGNAGNANGNPGNAGNVKKGKVKKDAGKRSGLSRSAKKVGNTSASGTLRNAGNTCASRTLRNSGNASAGGNQRKKRIVMKGKVKKDAGKRSCVGAG